MYSTIAGTGSLEVGRQIRAESSEPSVSWIRTSRCSKISFGNSVVTFIPAPVILSSPRSARVFRVLGVRLLRFQRVDVRALHLFAKQRREYQQQDGEADRDTADDPEVQRGGLGIVEPHYLGGDALGGGVRREPEPHRLGGEGGRGEAGRRRHPHRGQRDLPQGDDGEATQQPQRARELVTERGDDEEQEGEPGEAETDGEFLRGGGLALTQPHPQ